MTSTHNRTQSKILILMAAFIALSFVACADEGDEDAPQLSEAQAENDYMAATAAEFCQMQRDCVGDDAFLEENETFEGCVQEQGVALRAEAYAVSDACGEAFMEQARCSGPIVIAAYEGEGCDYRDHFQDYGGTLVNDDTESYYFPCPELYDVRDELCGDL